MDGTKGPAYEPRADGRRSVIPRWIDLVEELREVTFPNGVRAAVLDCVVLDDAPQEVKEGMARRRITNEGGRCPCGARMVMPNRAARRRGNGITRVVVEHERSCPAVTSNLLAALRRTSP